MSLVAALPESTLGVEAPLSTLWQTCPQRQHLAGHKKQRSERWCSIGIGQQAKSMHAHRLCLCHAHGNFFRTHPERQRSRRPGTTTLRSRLTTTCSSLPGNTMQTYRCWQFRRNHCLVHRVTGSHPHPRFSSKWLCDVHVLNTVTQKWRSIAMSPQVRVRPVPP